MSRQSTSPKAPRLPFPDDPVPTVPRSTAPGQPAPTAIISYTHETDDHNGRVLALSNRLIADGVDCHLDRYEVSPRDGWAAWIRRKLEECDYCIIICTETYHHRFAGPEPSGAGRGATWEGKLIRQLLYRDGYNRGVIPVLFTPSDRNYIPIELQDATYCDLSVPSGYETLHRMLTAQPSVQRPSLGPLRKHLPLLSSVESRAIALVAFCPDPLPLDVVSRAAETPDTAATLDRLQQANVVNITNGFARIIESSVADIPQATDPVIGAALEALLDFLEDRPGPIRPDQVMNAVALQKGANLADVSAAVAHTFRVIQSPLKSLGDKFLLLEVARRSIRASRALGSQRKRRQAEDEAVALICGTSWVYQRIGDFAKARDDAQASLRLGLDLGWHENTAYCEKCLGRLSRIESDHTSDPDQRAALLAESVSLLSKAISSFSTLKMEAEVGDCYSLLARTYLAQRKPRQAHSAIQEAQERLREPDTKDYLDLCLVRADLIAFHDPSGAESEYTKILADADHTDAQKSEIFARAYFSRATARSASGLSDKAVADYQHAADIWGALRDPTADRACWQAVELTAAWLQDDPRAKAFLYEQPLDVRVQVATFVNERLMAQPAARAHRATVTVEYLRGLAQEARAFLAVKRPQW